ncbi:hypothetical protein [cyanobacterium endosymbiont of Epithemia turgida]|uniref:hypothetical protein n=1 Tax=cyanobacterium endosymbiont of Epithemia turgida TaxID=718217 RepID=UPI0038CD1772
MIEQLTNLYRECLKPQTRILDLMNSWVSHFPDDLEFSHAMISNLRQVSKKTPQLNNVSFCDF